MAVVNLGCSVALGELVRFHIFIQSIDITTLEYLRKKEKVSKISKINIQREKELPKNEIKLSGADIEPVGEDEGTQEEPTV